MQNHEQAITGETRPDVRIERVTWRDLRAVAALQKESFRPGLAYGLSGLSILRAFPGVVFLVARTDTDPVVGCIIGDRHKGSVRIMNLAVGPNYRRMGIGSALLREVESLLPEGNVTLMAEEWNRGAQALYSREGYVRDGIARDYYGTGRHGVRMKKERGPQTTQAIRA